jgi:hypothetical protein
MALTATLPFLNNVEVSAMSEFDYVRDFDTGQPKPNKADGVQMVKVTIGVKGERGVEQINIKVPEFAGFESVQVFDKIKFQNVTGMLYASGQSKTLNAIAASADSVQIASAPVAHGDQDAKGTKGS